MKRDSDVEEIVNFINNYQPGGSLDEADSRDIFRRPYKQYYRILIWGLVAEEELGVGSDEELYFSECVSDLAHALLLTLIGFYKPSRMMMRSAAENFARFFTKLRSSPVTNEKSTYELLDAGKREANSVTNMRAEFDKICSVYGELCLTVHSAKIDYMALKVPFEELARFDAGQFGSNLHTFNKLATAANRALFALWHQNLHVLDHKKADALRDSVPNSFKKKFY